MKRLIILFVVFFILNVAGVAQYFGIHGGALATNVQWRDNYYTLNTLVKPGFMAGITLEFPIKNIMAVNTALNYKWTGASFIDSTDIAAVRLGYVNLDITVNYIFEGKTVRPYVEGGTYLGYLVTARSVFKPENKDVEYENLQVGFDKDDEIIPLDFGWTIGGGVYLRNWKFGLGYQASFINLSPDGEHILRNKIGYLRATFFFNRKKSVY